MHAGQCGDRQDFCASRGVGRWRPLGRLPVTEALPDGRLLRPRQASKAAPPCPGASPHTTAPAVEASQPGVPTALRRIPSRGWLPASLGRFRGREMGRTGLRRGGHTGRRRLRLASAAPRIVAAVDAELLLAASTPMVTINSSSGIQCPTTRSSGGRTRARRIACGSIQAMRSTRCCTTGLSIPHGGSTAVGSPSQKR